MSASATVLDILHWAVSPPGPPPRETSLSSKPFYARMPP